MKGHLEIQLIRLLKHKVNTHRIMVSYCMPWIMILAAGNKSYFCTEMGKTHEMKLSIIFCLVVSILSLWIEPSRLITNTSSRNFSSNILNFYHILINRNSYMNDVWTKTNKKKWLHMSIFIFTSHLTFWMQLVSITH